MNALSSVRTWYCLRDHHRAGSVTGRMSYSVADKCRGGNLPSTPALLRCFSLQNVVPQASTATFPASMRLFPVVCNRTYLFFLMLLVPFAWLLSWVRITPSRKESKCSVHMNLHTIIHIKCSSITPVTLLSLL